MYAVLYFCHRCDHHSQDLEIVHCYILSARQVKYAAFALGIMVAVEVEPGQEYGLRRHESNLSLHDRILSPPLSLESVALASRCSERFRAPTLSGVDESGGRRWHYPCVSRQRLSKQLARQQEPVGDRFPSRGLLFDIDPPYRKPPVTLSMRDQMMGMNSRRRAEAGW